MNSKPEANWCGLPVEMQLECIKRMDFKTRMRLRLTSKTEKSLVECAKKYNFDTIEIKWAMDTPLTIKCEKNSELEIDITRELSRNPRFGDRLKEYRSTMKVLRFADAETLKFNQEVFEGDDLIDLIIAISEFTPFCAKNIHLHCSEIETCHFIMHNAEDVETLVLSGDMETTEYLRMDNLMETPLSVNAKKFLNRIRQSSNCFNGLIEKWIERDAEVGTTLQACFDDSFRDKHMDSVAEKFENRIVSQKPTEIRLRTDNDSKHILIRALDEKKEFVSFVIIPADQKESEYEKDDGAWIEDIKAAEIAHNNEMAELMDRMLNYMRARNFEGFEMFRELDERIHG